MAEINVVKGDSTKVKEFTIDGYPDISATAWAGKKTIRRTLDGAIELEATMVKDAEGTMFLGYWEPAETDQLEAGTPEDPSLYVTTYEIENLSILPKFRREKQYTMEVKQRGVETV